VTEKHYSPWIRERQQQAEADVKRTWTQDPIALLETKGTPEVHEKRGPVNGGEGGILPLVQQEIPVMMVKPNLRVCNGTEAS
jgi:hypothetical protein